MEVCRRSSWLLLLLGVSLLATTLQGVQGEAESEGPSESECRPYIEKALKELETGEAGDAGTPETDDGDSKEDVPTVEITTDDSEHDSEGEHDTHEDAAESSESVEQNAEQSEQEDVQAEPEPSVEDETEKSAEDADDTTKEDTDGSQEADVKASAEDDDQKTEEDKGSDETAEATDADEQESKEDGDAKSGESKEDDTVADQASEETGDAASQETVEGSQEDTEEATDSKEEPNETTEDSKEDSKEDVAKDGSKEDETKEDSKEDEVKEDSKEDEAKEDSKEDETKEDSKEDEAKVDSKEEDATNEESKEDATREDSKEGDINEESKEEEKDDTEENDTKEVKDDSKEDETKSVEEASVEQQDSTPDEATPAADSKEDETAAAEDSKESAEGQPDETSAGDSKESAEGDAQPSPEEELSLDIEIPTDLRERDHVEHLLKIDDEASETENIINKIAEITLRELKKLYENAIKPLEGLYKYRDLSNRHFGDSEIFSKPLILFMGPWSGGKSSIINYLLDNEYNETSLRTGAEPSPAYFNILMHGDEPEIIDGTQLAADFTFSGLQKFGQGLEERLRGVKLPSKLLEKVNIVEIPGILEVRKQVSRVFPFNDACQWFIDRADIIFLVYDPSKLDVGPETEAILDQLKGREHQTRIILNKADQVKPEELMRVQGALIWNISPLMSSAQPPVMYTTSLWSRPYEVWAPTRLLQAQERAFLRDLRSAIEKRIDNKIASARRFAVRVRNHAKMVDCYLTTYYNHKSVFGNRKQVAEQIIEHPQDYHIYEGLSTLTNISRYDLPDPDVYKDFFKLNPLYEFQQLSATCTYFRGCPINRLDVAIAYDLPELVGKHKRLVESALGEATVANQAQVPGS